MDDYKKITFHILDDSGKIYIILYNPGQKVVYSFSGTFTSYEKTISMNELEICYGKNRDEYIKHNMPELCVYEKDKNYKKTTVDIDKKMKADIALWFTTVSFINIKP